MAVSLFDRLWHPATNGKDGRVYYCDANDCLLPMRFDQLAYGCTLCARPLPLLKDLKPEAAKRLWAALQESFTGGSPECRDHAGLRVVPRCPVCGEPIDRLGYSAPIGIWGAPNVGKTVYCAVLAKEIQDRIFSMTGLTVSPGYDRGRYERDVVQPLFGVKGRLPSKTRPDEHRTLVLRLDGGGWISRSLRLTDMSGEVYGIEPRAVVSDEDLERRQSTVLLAKESIFLANPEGSNALGAKVRPDLHGVLSALIDLPRIQVRLATAEAVERLARALTTILKARYFPSPVYSTAEGQPFQTLAQELAGCLQDPSLAEEIRECLEASAGVMARATPFTDQLQKLWRFMDRAGCPRIGDKLAHRIAVTVSKSDMLCDRPVGVDEILESHGIGTSGAGSPVRREEWRRALRKVAHRSEQRLVDLGEGEFVTWVKRHFAQAGFFFISSLGRATEPFATAIRRRRAHEFPRSQAADPSIAPPDTSPERDEPQWGWRLDKRMTIDPEVGSRAPKPEHVLLPLLWLLAEC